MVTPYLPNIGERRTTRKRILVHSETPPQEELQRQAQTCCRKCVRGHLLSLCPDFLVMSRNQRWDFVRNKNLCYCCLYDHTVRSCRSKRNCVHGARTHNKYNNSLNNFIINAYAIFNDVPHAFEPILISCFGRKP